MENKQKQPIKINFLGIVLIATILILVLASIFSILTPKKEKIIANDFAINNYDDTQSTFKKVSFSGNEIYIPEIFNIYQATKNTGLADDLASKIIAEYNLTADSSVENYWLSENAALSKNSYENYYVFNNVSSNKEGNNNLAISIDEAIKICQNFYSKYNFLAPLIPQKEAIVYLNNKFEQSKVDSSEASYAQIPLTYELDGYKVFFENQNSYPFLCRVNNLYNLERVIFRDFFQEFTAARQIPSISIDQAVKNIKNGKASIIDATSNIAYTLDLNWINNADLYAVKIEYRYDEKLKIAYPFYNFSAKITNAGGINIEAKIITPAVNTAKED